jgi:hypothetical protein
MKRDLERLSLVIAGRWNTAILSPDWLSKQIFNASEVGIMFPVLGWGPPIFEASGLRITATDVALTFSPTQDSDELLQKIEIAGRQILDTLCHTPVGAFGENFHYLVPDPPPELMTVINDTDVDRLSIQGAGDINETVLVRSIHLSKCQLNLKIVSGKAGQPWRVDLNYHYSLPLETLACDAAKQMAALMKDTFVSNRNHGLELLQSVYNLTLDKDTENEDGKSE